MVAVVVSDEDTIDVFGFEAHQFQPLLQLNTAEPLVDEHVDLRRGQKRGVATTSGAKVRDGERHANELEPTREGLEHTASLGRKPCFCAVARSNEHP